MFRVLIDDSLVEVNDHWFKEESREFVLEVPRSLSIDFITNKIFDLTIHSFRFTECRISHYNWQGPKITLNIKFNKMLDLGMDAIRDHQIRKILDIQK